MNYTIVIIVIVIIIGIYILETMTVKTTATE